MNTQTTVDQIQYLFTFPFKDEKWSTKFLIAFLLYLGSFIIPIIPMIFVFGYALRITENVIHKNEYTLPEWDDWGDLFVKGLKVFGILLIVSIPIGLFFGCGLTAAFVPMFSIDPNYIGEGGVMAAMFSAMFGSMCLFGIGMIVTLIVGLFVPPALGHMAAEDNFGAAFQFGKWWRVFKANLGGYLVAYLLLLGLSSVMYFGFYLTYMTIVLCWLIPFIGSALAVYLGIVTAALFGQTYRTGSETLELDAPLSEKAAA